MDTTKQKGIIYMIKVGEDIYIGSTRQKYLSSRQGGHNRALRKNKEFDLYVKCRELEITKIECIFISNYYFDTIEELCKEEEKYRIQYNATLNMKKCYTDLKGKDYNKQYYEENKEDMLKEQKQYYQENKEKKQEYEKKYREENKDKIKKYREDNIDILRKKANEKAKQYYYDNKEKVNLKAKEYYLINKEKCKERSKKYVENNKEKVAKIKKEWKLKNKEKNKEYKKEQIECEICNSSVRRDSLSTHKKSLKCIKFKKLIE